MNNSILKGGFLVALGASSYGMLTTFVKMAYAEGYTSYEITFSQMLLGLIGIIILNFLFVREKQVYTEETKTKSILKLMAAGTSLGLTSIFYYIAVKYIPVSIGIVLLMQSVWIGVLFEAVMAKKRPGLNKILAVVVILVGTVLATNILMSDIELDWRGIGWGLLAALSYTVTIYTSNTLALHLHSFRRSLWMMVGGTLIIAIISAPYLLEQFNLDIFLKWGLILALFGTILPPILFTSGMPKINVGLGAIISSVELPVAVLMAYLLLDEVVNIYQWIGIIIIILSVILMNMPKLFKKKK
ncbi:threonine/homoserine efflux transporter RhtA [Gillisia mitskevichiae]|uniref:Threonine/homoserine efflux transporter RhtA n=1 Tax=Gillisia mitskevichiae TaxID=270921 RepID=A0A495PXB9_9FLAO|nr:DMT family transporter [Gillisia mitskevichiae]RKS55478.1 threonine/homoserine efflux transporter RhtA [Gillisia mitskevichiae]